MTKNFIINIHLNNICNYQCIYCSENLPYLTYKPYNIPIDLLKYISIMIDRYLYNFNIYIYLYGGEPLLYPYLFNAIKVFNSNIYVKNIAIVSNNSIDINTIFNENIELNTTIHFTFSLHLAQMEKYNFNKQYTTFIDNIVFIRKNIPLSTINVLILKDFKYSLNYLEDIKNNLEKLNINTEIMRLHSTKNFVTLDNPKKNNEYYLQYRYTNRHITISKSFIDDKYYMSNQCEMSYFVESIYDIKSWKNLIEKYNNKVLCKQESCLCRYCNQIGYEQD